ncbi:MAG: hypothetical protein AAFX99_08300 [Myxococcota bacterium]
MTHCNSLIYRRHMGPAFGAWVTVWMMALGAMMLCATPEASAQSRVAEPTASQIDYYNRANQAYQEGDYTKAVTLLEVALDEGEINILYLNLGRALSKLGRCEEAEKMYGKALKAPSMASPTAAQVKAKIDEYRNDMKRECPGLLVVKCEPGSLVLTIDDGDARLCDGAPISLAAGSYKIKGSLPGNAKAKPAVDVVTVTSMQTTTALLTVEVGKGTPEPEKPKAKSVSALPWITVGVGSTILVASFILDATVVKNDVDEFKLNPASFIADPSLHDGFARCISKGKASGGGGRLVGGEIDQPPDKPTGGDHRAKDDPSQHQVLRGLGVVLGSVVAAGGLVWGLIDLTSDQSPSTARGLPLGDAPGEPVVQGWIGDEGGGVQLELTW